MSGGGGNTVIHPETPFTHASAAGPRPKQPGRLLTTQRARLSSPQLRSVRPFVGSSVHPSVGDERRAGRSQQEAFLRRE